jgi:hypothetical protein
VWIQGRTAKKIYIKIVYLFILVMIENQSRLLQLVASTLGEKPASLKSYEQLVSN